MALRANSLRRHAELLAERPRECLVRAVARLERHTENVRRTVGKGPRGFGQAPAAQVAHDRLTQRAMEDAREVIARHPGDTRDVVETYALAEMTLDEPKRLVDGIHSGSHLARKPIYAERTRPV